MNENGALLNDIYRLSQMGEVTLRSIRRFARNDALVEHHALLGEAYQSLNLQALQMLNRYGIRERELTRVRRYLLYGKVRRKVRRAAPPAGIARLLLYQSVDCVVLLAHNLRIYPNAHPDARAIAEKMLHIQELNIAQLKTHL